MASKQYWRAKCFSPRTLKHTLNFICLSQSVTATSQLSQQVFAKIDDKALVKDSASPELARIRKRLRDEQSRLRKLADQIFKNAVSANWVPEGALPTIRDGRVVIPIQAEHKRKLKGFILDESATGQTVFMEPTEMLDANNEIRELEHEEKREVIRILKALTDEFRIQLPVLKLSFRFLAQIDFIRAKAKFSLEIEADKPILEKQPELTWYNAKHPLLYLSLKGKRDVVPLSIELNPEDRMLLVSGPNAGGKSVCLKTVGLLTIHGSMRIANSCYQTGQGWESFKTYFWILVINSQLKTT